MVLDEEMGLAEDGAAGVERTSLVASKTMSFDTPLVLSSFAIRPNGVLEEVPVKEAMASISSSSGSRSSSTIADPLWLDVEIQGDIQKQLPLLTESVVDQLDLTPFLRRHLNEPTQLQTPQVLPLSQSALVVMRIMASDEKNTRHAAALCLPSVLLTVTSSTDEGKEADQAVRGKTRSLHLQKDTLESIREYELPEASISGAAALWFQFHLGRSALATIKLRKNVYDLIAKSEDIEQIKMKDINDCKDLLLRFASVAEEQLECVQSLEGGDAMSEGLDFTSPVLAGALSVIMSTAGSTERAVARLEKRVADLQTKYDANQQDKINHRLNVLTIISAVFLPLSLLTGFWGMNWENGMPAIHTEYGFYYALAGMIVLAFVLLGFFHRAGWMDH